MIWGVAYPYDGIVLHNVKILLANGSMVNVSGFDIYWG
jgi:hypothetical protein